MGLFSKEPKTFSEMTDSELIRFINHPPFGTSSASLAKAIKEAISRGLTNPRTGEPYHY